MDIGSSKNLTERINKLSFLIEAKDKSISIREIMRAISKEAGVEIKYPLRQRGRIKIQLDKPRARLAIAGLNFVLNPAIQIQLANNSSGLQVTIEQNALKEQFKAMLHDQSDAWTDGMGLKLVDATHKAQAKRLIVLIHGYQSSTAGLGNLIEQIDRANPEQDHLVATFEYPSRLGVAEVSDRLSQELHEFLIRNEDLKVTLVTHSMGGIVARHLIELEERDFAAIDRLIMVAPPNHGSELARVGMSGDTLETLLATIDRPRLSKVVLGTIESLDQSAGDMVPGSEVITELNKQTRNPNVSYSILLGNKSFLSDSQAAMFSAGLNKVNLGTARFLADSVKQLTGELVDEKGDGVVALESGKLDGVKDIQIMLFSHNDILNSEAETQESIIDEILKRLKFSNKTTR